MNKNLIVGWKNSPIDYPKENVESRIRHMHQNPSHDEFFAFEGPVSQWHRRGSDQSSSPGIPLRIFSSPTFGPQFSESEFIFETPHRDSPQLIYGTPLVDFPDPPITTETGESSS